GSAEELAGLKDNAARADMALLDEGETTCCYARSDKYWVTDPQGVAWEQFHTLDSIPVFSEATPAKAGARSAAQSGAACCAAPAATAAQAAPAKACC
ncbi:MAG: glyoxalase/bleomycin resistance/dioxygenase family protein, partial [Comamonadaceae bacterium]